MKKYLTIITGIIGLFLISCGGIGGSSDLTVRVDGKDKNFVPKSTWAYHSTKSFSYPENGKTVMTKSSSSHVVLANYELDTKQAFISLNKQKIEKPDQIKVSFSFTGEKETSVDTPIKSGEYTAEADKFQKIDSVIIYYFDAGKEKRVILNDSKLKGKLIIDSVSGATINGSIDVTDGENSIKGNFSAKGDDSVK